MIESATSTVPFFQFPGLAADPRIAHAVSARGKERSWNMSYSVSPKHGDAAKSREELLRALRLPASPLAVAGQVHGKRVQLVESVSLPRDPRRPHQNLYLDTDGLVTEEVDLPLLVTAADCPPVFLFDPERPAIGIVHSGWRGTWAGIAAEAVSLMRQRFGTRPQSLRAAVGPGIGSCCYEVGDDLIGKLDASGRKHLLLRNGARVLDLASWIVTQLRELGIPESGIERSPYCTSCHRSHFFSHRAEKGDTGRVAAVIALRQPK